jgi:hypothetical protein
MLTSMPWWVTVHHWNAEFTLTHSISNLAAWPNAHVGPYEAIASNAGGRVHQDVAGECWALRQHVWTVDEQAVKVEVEACSDGI